MDFQLDINDMTAVDFDQVFFDKIAENLKLHSWEYNIDNISHVGYYKKNEMIFTIWHDDKNVLNYMLYYNLYEFPKNRIAANDELAQRQIYQFQFSFTDFDLFFKILIKSDTGEQFIRYCQIEELNELIENMDK